MSEHRITKRRAEKWLRRNNWTKRWLGAEADPWINPDLTNEEIVVYHEMDRYRTYADRFVASVARAYQIAPLEAAQRLTDV